MTPSEWSMLMDMPPFEKMGRDAVRVLIRDRPSQSVARGAQIFHQGDPAETFFVVFDGRVKYYRQREDGEEVVVGIARECESFAEMAMFIGGRYPVSAQAVTDGRLIRIDGCALRHAIELRPELAFDLMAAAAAQLHYLFDQIEQLKRRPTLQRIADFLLELNREQTGSGEIALPYGKALIANHLGMTPESFSRGLSKLRGLGVTVERDRVRIEDTERLENYVND